MAGRRRIAFQKWGMKAGYRMMDDMGAKVCSKNTASRISCFLHPVAMFNARAMISMLPVQIKSRKLRNLKRQ